jgi:hypothetical protein
LFVHSPAGKSFRVGNAALSQTQSLLMARVIDSTMLLMAMLKLLVVSNVTANGSFGSNGQIPGFPTNFVYFALHQRSDRSRWTVKRTSRFRDTADPWYPKG